jgi:hypothetical protein
LAIPDKVVHAFDQRAEPTAKVQFSALFGRCPEPSFLISLTGEPDRRSGGSVRSVRQALKDLDQLTEPESPAIEEVESEENRR